LRYSRLLVLTLLMSGLPCALLGQTRRRIAVVPDAHVSPERQAIEIKVVDALLAKLAENASVEAIDRSQLQALMSEMGVKYNPYFDKDDVANIGRLKGVSVLIVVTVSDLEDNVSEEAKRNPLYTQVTVTGVVNLRVSAKALAVETASVLSAPSTTVAPPPQEFKKFKDMSGAYAQRPPQVLNSAYGTEMARLVGGAVDQAAGELYDKLAPALTVAVAAAKPAQPGMVAGIVKEGVLINRGSASGYKVGDRFQVIRVVDSGILDPQTKQPILRNKKICLLVLSDVDDNSATGSCQGDVPQASDQLLPAGAK
jgi:Curli production assembly/transport component CsgG